MSSNHNKPDQEELGGGVCPSEQKKTDFNSSHTESVKSVENKQGIEQQSRVRVITQNQFVNPTMMREAPSTIETLNSMATEKPEVVITNLKKEEKVNKPQVKTDTPDSHGDTPTGVKIREKIFDDGHKEIWFSNGNREEVSANGRQVKVFYFNGDLKEVGEDGSERYLYSETQTWHIKMTDGTEIIQFSNGQQV